MSRFIVARMLVVLLAGVVSTSATAVAQTTWYVDDDADPSGDGLTWFTAFDDLQDALGQALAGDEIRVAGGTYVPSMLSDPNDPRTATFQLLNGVDLYGGFAGLADLDRPDARNTELYGSVLSGDLAGDDSPDFVNYEENSYHVVSGVGCDQTAGLDGFSVYGGSADGASPHNQGGGMYISQGSPTLIGCTFTGNRVMGERCHGGAISCDDYSDPTIVYCVFIDNRASGHRSRGGAMSCSVSSSPVISDSMFISNQASGVFSGGGGLSCDESNPTIAYCVIAGNSAEVAGGMMLFLSDPIVINTSFVQNSTSRWNGGAVYAFVSSAIFTRCTIAANWAADSGGGVYCTVHGPVFIDCRIENNHANAEGGGVGLSGATLPKFMNCILSGNSAAEGGALFGSNPRLTNCTIVANAATNFGGVANVTLATLSNCILWGNSDSNGMVESSQFQQTHNAATVDYCCIQGWTGTLGGTGNTGSVPQFVNAAGPDGIPGTVDDDLRLSPGSPCIDAGCNGIVTPDLADLDGDGDTDEPTPFDLYGNPRFADDAGMPDIGDGLAPLVDMGACEFQGETCFADLDSDGVVASGDLIHLLMNYHMPGEAAYLDGDLDRDGDVDIADLAALLAVYGSTCE